MSYKILKLTSENFVKIKFAEITPTSNVVVISGKNGNGKSSLLNTIPSTLGGIDSKSYPEPIHNGAEYAKNTILLGVYNNLIPSQIEEYCTVTRNWTSNDKSYLKIEAKDGTKFKNPQQLLDKIIGDLTFEPLEFCNLEPKKQVEILMNLVGLREPLFNLDIEKKKIYNERTDINKEVETLKIQLKNYNDIDTNLPDTEIDTNDLINELNRANGIIRENQSARNELMNVESVVNSAENEIARLTRRITDLQQQIAKNQNTRNLLMEKIVDDPDTKEITNRIAGCNETNNRINKSREYRVKKDEYNTKVSAAEYCTERLKELEEEKIELLKKANFPIDGLGFNDDGILFNGIPFIQCSSAEKLKVSMSVAMALNPQLRVIRIMNGNLLDKDSKKYVKQVAEERDFQVWIEEVANEKGTVGFYIEDGEIK